MQENGLIQELPLSVPFFRKQVETFLLESSLRMEELDHYYACTSPDGSILAGAGIKADIIKCVAVAPSARSEGYMLPLLSRVVSDAAAKGIMNLKVFTKPENREIFESIGFKVLASAPKAILMENGRGLDKYCQYLSRHARPRPGISGVIVMNANPFTLGHKYLIDKALEQVDHLFVIPVKEDASAFPYLERLAMIRAHADARITVLEGSDYCISAATFPTYFLKDLSDAAETQMQLDIDLFERHIMPALGATVRFVGSEPLDPLTARYNALMHNAVVIPRLVLPDTSVMPDSDSVVMPDSDRASAHQTSEQNYFSGRCPKNQFSSDNASPTHADAAVSASRVRAAIEAGDYASAAALCPVTTHPYLLAALAERALMMELDTPMKPGLVGPDGPGAHKDMDYSTMRRGIAAIRPFWSRMVTTSSAEELRQAGIEAEAAMIDATGGVNTHRGAIFCLGLALNAMGAWRQNVDTEQFVQKRLPEIAQTLLRNQLTDSTLAPRKSGGERPAGIKDARAMALDGYSVLFTDWLPFFMSCSSMQKTLLRIMSTLDDTCVIKRVGVERAQQVKREAAEVLQERINLKDMCLQYAREGISPGGAADMLALTIFINSII